MRHTQHPAPNSIGRAPAQPDRHALHGLLVAGACAVAPHALELPLWIIGVFMVGAAWRYSCETFQWYRPGRVLRLAFMLLVIAGIFRQYGTLLGRDPGIALLVSLMGLKFLELKSLRDFVVSVFVFYLVILGSFLYSQSLWLGVWALPAVVACTAVLIHLMQPTGMGTLQRLRLSGVMLAKALPLMLVAYLLFPRISGTLWGLPTDAYAGITGLSDTMQPGSIRSLSESYEIAFRVSFDGAPPPVRELYWRGIVLTETDGRGWSRAPLREVKKPKLVPLSDPVRYHVTLEPSNKPWMPVLDLPFTEPKGARYQADFTLEHRESIHERLNYTLTSYTRYRTGALEAQERTNSLRLPAKTSARVQALAATWREGNAHSLQVARAALDHFHRENFVYTLSPPLLGEYPVDEFLFTARRGFCEHYAAAFVTLMRAAGIPSRIVLGYLGGEINTAGNYLIVRQLDAHAWAEIWTEERGWVRVDPTGAIAPERIELGLDAVRRLELQGLILGSLPAEALQRVLALGWFERTTRQARWYWDLTNLAWYRWVVDYGKERQERFLASLGLDDISWGRLLSWLPVGMLLVTLVYALLLLRTKKSTDPIVALYLRFCRKLARVGLVRAPHEAASVFTARAAATIPLAQVDIQAIGEIYSRLRYGTERDTALLRELKQRIHNLRLREKLGGR